MKEAINSIFLRALGAAYPIALNCSNPRRLNSKLNRLCFDELKEAPEAQHLWMSWECKGRQRQSVLFDYWLCFLLLSVVQFSVTSGMKCLALSLLCGTCRQSEDSKCTPRPSYLHKCDV